MTAHEYHMNDELLVKYLLGELIPGEKVSVERWINASPANRKYFEHFQLIWETSKKIAVPSSINEENAWKRFQERIEHSEKPNGVVISINRRVHMIRAASIAILLIGTALLGYYFYQNTSASPVTVASVDLPKTDSLPDGSVVLLNKNSSITYPKKFKGNERKIELKGEAFFDVTPNRQKPFIVQVNGITVSVVGTSFNIKSIAGVTEVVVETGIVRVTKNNRTVELRPREKLNIGNTDSILTKETVTDRLHQYYRSKQFVCDSTPLWKLIEVLNEAYNAEIEIGRAELRTLPLTTTFNNESLDKILSIISETFDITVEEKNGKIILK